MTQKYRKLLLSQLRMAPYKQCTDAESTVKVKDEYLVKSMTANANLSSLGYTLNPQDILRLAVSPSLDTFTERISEVIDTVDAAPMYPDFPRQVMEMPEAQFRLHQLIHYFSTYGLEDLLGCQVSRGWLPDVKATEKTQKDDRLLSLKVLELVEEDQAYIVPARRILCKRERMTLPEKEIVSEAIRHLTTEEIASLVIPFKENMEDLVILAFDEMTPGEVLPVLQALCKHTGDVLRNIGVLLKVHKYHFRTSQKRLLVKLIESYPVQDWKANVILSNQKAERTIMLVDHLDYSTYSRSPEHMGVVNSLKDGELHSWEGQAKALLKDKPGEALDFIAKRPGMLLRMTAWLLRLGFDKEAIAEKLCASAETLSTQTLMTVLNFFGKPQADREEANDVYEVMERAIRCRLAMAKTPFAGKKVFVDNGGFNLELGELKCNEKSVEGGYIPSGAVYRIPEDVRYVRFFCYWNDNQRVDVDLHARAKGSDGEDIYIGWNSSYKKYGIVQSGDITHSDAAEYIDVDLNAPVDRVTFNLHLYSGRKSFAEVETCFAGLMAVKNIDENVQLYDPANCFVSHEIRGETTLLQYGFLDVVHRVLVFDGVYMKGYDPNEWYRMKESSAGKMNIARYLEILLEAQDCVRVNTREEADTILVIEKPQAENELSLTDNNYFMDA